MRIAGLAICALMIAFRAVGAESAWILDYGPPDADTSVTHARDGKVTEISLGLPLSAGDVLRAGGNARIVLGLADGSERELKGPGRWEVPEPRTSSTFLQVMQGVFGLASPHGTVAASAATRDAACQSDPTKVPPPRLPRNQKLPAGRQDVAIGWSGGCPPFEFTLREGDRDLYKVPQSKSRLHFLQGMDLPPGRYTLQVMDGRGQQDSVTLIAAGISPTPPPDLQVPSETMAGISKARWLSQRDGGVWRLEGLRVLKPLIDTNNRLAIHVADEMLNPDSQ